MRWYFLERKGLKRLPLTTTPTLREPFHGRSLRGLGRGCAASRFKHREETYSIFELSVNTTSGAPSFVRSLRRGWETADIHRNWKHPGRKRFSGSLLRSMSWGLSYRS